MEQIFQHGLSNAAAAALLAILAAIATRIWRNPHFAYAAWLIVLVRLVAPPLVPVSVPAPTWSTLADYGSGLITRVAGLSNAPDPLVRTQASTDGRRAEPNRRESADRAWDVPMVRRARNDDTNRSNGVATTPIVRGTGESIPPDVRGGQPRGSEVQSGDTRKSGSGPGEPTRFTSGTRAGDDLRRSANSVLTLLSPLKRLSISQWLMAIWLAGTCCYLLLVGVRAARFSRALRAGRLEVAESLRAEAVAAAATVGLRRLPKMAMLAAPLPPFVWPGWRPTVLLPQALVDSLGVSQRRLLLLHEFVHLRRLDHRVRWFQIGVVALYWWNPIAWWAARRLERAEEECCDAAVLRLQPDQAEGYGQTLVAVTEFLSTGRLPAPALSIGIVRKNHLKQRLTMILSGPRWPGLSKTRFAVLAIVGAALVALTWRGVTAQNAPTSDSVTTRWFKTDTKTALEPTVVTPSRADARLALAEIRLNEFHAAMDAAAPEEIKTQTVSTPAEEQRLAALLKLESLKIEPGDDELQKLFKERYNAALRAVKLYQDTYEAGTARAAPLCAARRELVEAELALVNSRADQIRIVEEYVNQCTRLWKQAQGKLIAGGVTGFSPVDEADARAARYEAEIKLFRLRDELKEQPPKRVAAAVGSVGAPDKPAGQTQTATETVAAGPEFVFLEKPAGSGKSLPALLYPKRLEAAPGDDELRKLLKEKYNASQRAMEVYTSRILVSGSFPSFGDFFAAGRNLRDALLALSEKPETQFHILETFLEFTRYLEKIAEAKLLASGPANDAPLDAARMREARADAELKLLELRQRAEAHDQTTRPRARQSAVSPNADGAGTPSPPTSARPDGAESLAGPAPDIHDAAGPLNPSGKRLLELVKFDNQQPQPGESAQRKQLMERYNDALRSVKSKVNQFEQGKTSAKLLCNAAREFTDARLALFEDPWQRIPIANWYTVFALKTWREAEAKLHAGGNTRENRADEAAAREAFLDARAEYAALVKVLPALMTSKLAEILPNDDDRKKLLIERYNAALRALRASYVRHRVDSTVPFTEIIAAARQVLPADVALQTQPEGRLRAHEHYLELMKYLEKEAESLRKARVLAQHELDTAHEARIDAEIKLLDAKSGGSAKTGPPET